MRLVEMGEYPYLIRSPNTVVAARHLGLVP